MSIFLFLKQFVDLLYAYRWMDIFMVILAMVMLVYQYLLLRPNIKESVKAADIVVLLLVALLTFSFFRDISAFQAYIKVMSAFLMYFMGRLYYDRINECGDALALSSYLIIYLNFVHRVLTYGTKLFQVTNADGDLYFYDTDMAYGIILAFIFVAMFARNSIFKMLTLVLICPYMILYSDAGIQMLLFFAIVVVLILYIVEVAIHKKTFAMIGMGVLIAGLLACVVLIYIPLLTSDTSGTWKIFGNNAILNVTHMETRYSEWQQVYAVRSPETLLEKIWGISFNTGLPLKSFYLKALYTTGIVGLLLGIVLIVLSFIAANRSEERKNFYITVMLAILMLGSGVTVNSMETTQMSWFVMLFAGMVITENRLK